MGDRIPKKDFLKILIEKLGISERSVYRKIRKALDRNEIKEIYLDDGTPILTIPEDDPLSLGNRIDLSRFREYSHDPTFNRKEALWMALVDIIPDEEGGRAWRKFAERYRWVRKGADPEEEPGRLDENGSKNLD